MFEPFKIVNLYLSEIKKNMIYEVVWMIINLERPPIILLSAKNKNKDFFEDKKYHNTNERQWHMIRCRSFKNEGAAEKFDNEEKGSKKYR